MSKTRTRKPTMHKVITYVPTLTHAALKIVADKTERPVSEIVSGMIACCLDELMKSEVDANEQNFDE